MKIILIAHPDHSVHRSLDVAMRNLHYETTPARDGLDVIDQALDSPPSAIILGTGLAGLNGLDAARALRALATTRRIPILFVTTDAYDSAQVQQAGLELFDWVEEPLELARVSEQMNRLLERAASLPSESVDSDRPLASISDSLTGLYGRNYMLHRLAYEAARAARYGNAISALLVGLRELDAQTPGSSGPDRVLVTVANLLRRTLRVVDLVGRTGAAEFLIIAPHTDSKGAEAVAKRVQRMLESANIELNGGKTQIRVCIGIGVSSGASLADNLALFARAEAALDAARRDTGQSIFIAE